MANVHEVEATVGERNGPLPGAVRRNQIEQLLLADDSTHAQRPCCDASARTARRSSAADTVAVPRFMTTIPPA